MRTRFVWMAMAGLAAGACMFSATAQVAGGGGGASAPGSTVGAGNQMGHSTMTQDQFNKLQDYADFARRLSKEKGKTTEQLLAEDKADAAALVARMSFACKVDQAIEMAEGPETVDGKTVQTKTYEVSCVDGMGYFLISQDPAEPYGISCFAADFTHAADVAAHRTPGPVCGLLVPNADLNAMASALMTKAGTPCTVKNRRWVGQNSKAHTEYDEVVCSDNSGYIVAVALPGSTAAVHVSTCHDAAKNGLPCKLSDNGPGLISPRTFKDALAQHKIACDADPEKDIHFFGQENLQKRYVVEFRCSQRPSGLVAYIPAEGSKAPFEAIDCGTAAKRRPAIMCTLTPPK